MPSRKSLALHSVMIASHRGIDPDYWRVKEVWYVDDYDVPLPLKAREYYWNSEDVMRRIEEMKNAGCVKPLIPQRTFVLAIKQIMEPEVIFLLEKNDLVEVKDRFEQTLAPAPRWAGISLEDYDLKVLGRRTTLGQAIFMAIVATILVVGLLWFSGEILIKIVPKVGPYPALGMLCIFIIAWLLYMKRWINFSFRAGEKLAGVEYTAFP